MKYWIDTDAGVDDALALAWVFRSSLDIVGISTVAGNLSVASAVNNIKALTEHYNREEIPVYRGAGCSFLGASINASHVHGVNLGSIELTKSYTNDGHLMQALPQFFENSSENLTIVTLGPLTNIASFLVHYPEYRPRITEILIMGGGSCGNISPYGEFNIYADPEAAQMVLSSRIPIVLSDIDITDIYAYITPEELHDVMQKTPLEDWADRLLQFRVEKSHAPKAARIYDVLPFIYILFPNFFTYDIVPVEVQLEGKMRGYTAYDYINNRENNFLFPEKNVPRIKRLRSIDRSVYRDVFISQLIK